MTEPVGSVAEEAAKLIAALGSRVGEWDGHHEPGATKDTGSHTDAADGHEHGDEHGPEHGLGHDHKGHNGQSPPECRWCPLCQGVRYAQTMSPEVREHLTNAVMSFAMALKGLLETTEEKPEESTSPVEKITLAEE